MFKVMFASALTDEAKWAALKQYVVRVGHIRDALEYLVRWNEHHRAVRACQAAVDDTLQQRMQQLQQPQHDGTDHGRGRCCPRRPMVTAPRGRRASICKTLRRWMASLCLAPSTLPLVCHHQRIKSAT